MIINQINKNLIYTVCLLIIGAILYGHTLWFSFTALDDNELIFQNIKKFQDFSNFPNLFLNSIDQSVNAPFYRPLLMVSFVIDSLAGNGSLFSFHFTNLVIHILVSMLVFVFFEMITNSKKSAFLVAILFLVHPIHTQAVVWIPGRNDTLLTLFSLSAVISLMKYLKTTKTVWLFLNIISFLFAMYTKEQAVLLIFIFGYLSYSSYKNSKFLALFLLWAATSLLFLIPRSLIMAGDFIFNIQSYPIFMAGIIKAFIISVGKVVLPVYQSVLPSTSSTPIWPGILSIMVILILTFTGKILNRHLLGFGVLWFILMGSVPLVWGSLEDLHFEHRLYLPSIGIFLILLHLGVFSSIYKRSPTASLIGVIFILTVFSIKTWNRSFAYYDEFSFAKSAVNESPDNYRSYYIMGNVQKSKGEFYQAISWYDKALELNPNNPDILNNRGDSFLQIKSFNDALKDFNSALDIKPDNLAFINNRAVTYYFLEEYDLAWKDIQFVKSKGGLIHPDFYSAISEKINSFKILDKRTNLQKAEGN